MKIDLIQGSKTWHTWRDTGIGGSDANVIFSGREADIERMIFEKANLISPKEIPPFAKNIGLKYEPIIRKSVEESMGINLPAECHSHDIIQWMHASLDGGSEGVILEAKASGGQLHAQTAMGLVPFVHTGQCLHNMMCAGVNRCIYAVCDVNTDEISAALMCMEDFEEDAAVLLLAEHAAWDCVKELYAPYDLGGMAAEQLYIAGKAMESKAKAMLKDAREQLLAIAGDRSIGRVGRIKFRKVETKGRIEQGLMLAAGINIEEYRGPYTEQYRFTVQKDDEILSGDDEV